MFRIPVALRFSFRTRVRSALLDLVRGQPMWLAGNWNKGVYHKYLQAWFKGLCSTCSFATGDFSNGMAFTIKVKDTDRIDQPTLNAHVASMFVPSTFMVDFRNHLKTCMDQKRRVAMVLMIVSFHTSGDVPNGKHATVWVFDFAKRMQVYYDPHDGQDKKSMSVAFSHLAPILPGWTVASANDTTPPLCANSLQTFFEDDMHQDEHGVCGLMVSLVLWVCVRFQYYNPYDVSKLIQEAFPLAKNRNTFICMYISWFDAWCKKRNQINAAGASAFGDIWFPPPVAPGVQPCSVLSASTGRMCSRAACGVGPMRPWCWQHRHIIANRSASSQKCAADQVSTCHLPSP